MRKLLRIGKQGSGERLRVNLARWSGLGLLLLAFAVRTYALGRQELTFDEIASFFIANRGPLRLLAYVRGAVREHPPLYYALLSLWMPLAGKSEFAIRFLSVIIGTGTVAVIYRGVRRSSHQSLALLSALLLTVSPLHIRISRDARMYGLLALWSLVSITLFLELTEQEQRRSPPSPSGFAGLLLRSKAGSRTTQRIRLASWGGFWLATGLGMFTHYFMVFVLVAEDLYLLLNWRRFQRLLRPWLAVHAALAGLLGVWAVLSPGLWATLVSFWNRGIVSAVRWEALARALNGLYLGATQRPNWHYLGLCLLVTTLGFVAFRYRKPSLSGRRGEHGLLHGLVLAVPIAAMLALPERISGRYLTSALPTSVVLMAAGLIGLFAFLKDRVTSVADGAPRLLIAGLLPLGLLCGILLADVRSYSALPSAAGESFRAKTEYLDAHARSEDGLLLHGPWQQLLLSYYDAGRLETYAIPLSAPTVDLGGVDATLRRIFETHPRLWVSYGSVEPVDPEWIVSRWLHEHAHQVLADQGLVLYYRSPAQGVPRLLRQGPSEDAEPGAGELDFQTFLPLTAREEMGYERATRLDVRFGEKVELTGVALSNTALTSGEAVLLLSQWRALQDIDPGLVMRLELIGPGSQVWAHHEFSIGPAHVAPKGRDAGETFTERRGLVVPIGTPPGEYTLRLRVLSPGGEEWLPTDAERGEVGLVHVQHHAPPSKEVQALPGHELRVTFEETISLIGYAPWGYDFSQGNPLLFDVYWQAQDAPDKDYELQIDVVRNDGSILTERRVRLVAAWSPTSSWEAQDVLKGHYAIPLPPDAPPGPYRIRLALIGPDGSPLAMEGYRTRHILDWWEREETLDGTDLVLFRGKIKARPRQYQAPAMEHRVDIVLTTPEGESKLRLLGYDLTPASVKPGDLLELTLYWKTLGRMEHVYAVFNHLVDQSGAQLAQQDGWPRGGTYHTSQWLPGEVVEDQYTIQVPADAPAGEYVLRVGMYDAATKERLLIAVDGTTVPEGYVELTTVAIDR